MRATTRIVLVTVAVAAVVAAYSQRTGLETSAEKKEPPEQAAGSELARAHALLEGRQYDGAIDAFLLAASYKPSTREAVAGAIEAMDRKVADRPLPDKLDAAVQLQKRLPTTARRDELKARVLEYLLAPVVKQAKQADALLKDRSRFIEDMWENDEGDVGSASIGGRALTEAEAREAQRHLKELGMPYAVMDLYIHEERLAAAMDRFVHDDERYLRQEEVSDEALYAMTDSCSQLGDALWPVQRRLDRLKPDWRK